MVDERAVGGELNLGLVASPALVGGYAGVEHRFDDTWSTFAEVFGGWDSEWDLTWGAQAGVRARW